MSPFRIGIVWISPRGEKSKQLGASGFFQHYLERTSYYARCQGTPYVSEEAFFKALSSNNTRPFLILLDSRGKQLTSEQFAAKIGQLQDQGIQQVIFAVGPADGWSEAARQRADLLLSLGPMTLPHELARVVLVEQIYRAFTILSGHPYHSGH